MVLAKHGNFYVSISTEEALRKAFAKLDEVERLERRFGFDHTQQIEYLLQEAEGILRDLEREDPSTVARVQRSDQDGDPSEDVKALAKTDLMMACDALGLEHGELGIRWDNTACPDAPRGATCGGHVDRDNPHILHLNPNVKRDRVAALVGHEAYHASRLIKGRAYDPETEESDAEGFGQWLARRLSGRSS